MYILNVFTFGMVAEFPASVSAVEIDLQTAQNLCILHAPSASSAVGHADTAKIFSAQLGVNISMSRPSLRLIRGDTALLGQYCGPRLPEGCCTLPEGAKIKWLFIRIE